MILQWGVAKHPPNVTKFKNTLPVAYKHYYSVVSNHIGTVNSIMAYENSIVAIYKESNSVMYTLIKDTPDPMYQGWITVGF